MKNTIYRTKSPSSLQRWLFSQGFTWTEGKIVIPNINEGIYVSPRGKMFYSSGGIKELIRYFGDAKIVNYDFNFYYDYLQID